MKIILASQSPRRKYLLEQMDLAFQQIPSDFKEYFDDNRPVEEVVKELGLGKARDVAADHPEDIIIGSDLIVVIDGRQIGKPESEEEAKQLLRNLSGRTHDLICSIAVVCKTQRYEKVLTDTARVTFDRLSDSFITEYVATGTTYDKAGGYAIQHPMMRPHISKVEGRIDTIVGLPTNLLAQLLQELGIKTKAIEFDSKSLESELLFN